MTKPINVTHLIYIPIRMVYNMTIIGEMIMFSPRKEKIKILKTSVVREFINYPKFRKDFAFNLIFSNFH